MKKKFLRFISLVTIVCISFSFSSCNMLKRIFVLFEDKITYEEQEKMENDKLLRDIVDIIELKSEISNDKKENLYKITQELENVLKDILNDTRYTTEGKKVNKKETLEIYADKFERYLNAEEEYLEIIISTLLEYEYSKNLGAALGGVHEAIQNKENTQEAKKQLTAVLNDMRNNMFDRAGYYDEVIASIEGAIENADDECKIGETEPHALKVALRGFVDNLKYLRDEVDVEGADFEEVEKISKEKFNESEKAMVEAIEDIKDLEDKIDEIKDKLSEEITKIEENLPQNPEEEQKPEEEEKAEPDEELKGETEEEIDKNENMSDENKEDLKDKIDDILKDENLTDDQKKEEIKDAINDSNMSDENKEDLKDKVDEIVGDQNKTDEEKADDLKDAVDDATKDVIKDQIDEFENSFEDEAGGEDTFVPGGTTLDDLFNEGFFENEPDQYWGSDLTDEEREALENYYNSLKGNE